MGINTGITTRTALTGALIIEVPGPENGPKADALASRIRKVLKNKENIRVDRPEKMAEIRVKNLECSITEQEVRDAIMEKIGCRAQEVQMGTIQRSQRGQGSLWLRVPLAAVRKVAEEGIIRVGWSRTKVDLLENRPLRCYRCLERGHVREECNNTLDRSKRCYRCGGDGHTARGCRNPPRCPLCADLGRAHSHILGGKQCAPQRRDNRRACAGIKESAEMTKVDQRALVRETEVGNIELLPLPQRRPRSRVDDSNWITWRQRSWLSY